VSSNISLLEDIYPRYGVPGGSRPRRSVPEPRFVRCPGGQCRFQQRCSMLPAVAIQGSTAESMTGSTSAKNVGPAPLGAIGEVRAVGPPLYCWLMRRPEGRLPPRRDSADSTTKVSCVVLMLGATLVSLGACQSAGQSGSAAQSGGQLTPADVTFVDTADMAGLAEVAFAQLALTKTSSPELGKCLDGPATSRDERAASGRATLGTTLCLNTAHHRRPPWESFIPHSQNQPPSRGFAPLASG
jgi:hypothetical protein